MTSRITCRGGTKNANKIWGNCLHPFNELLYLFIRNVTSTINGTTLSIHIRPSNEIRVLANSSCMIYGRMKDVFLMFNYIKLSRKRTHLCRIKSHDSSYIVTTTSRGHEVLDQKTTVSSSMSTIGLHGYSAEYDIIVGTFRTYDFFHAMNTTNYRAEVAAHGPCKATMFDQLALEGRTVLSRSLGFPRCCSAPVEIGGSSRPPSAGSPRTKLHFPHRLFRMLEEIRLCRPYLSHIISWHEDCDTAFVINNLEAFLTEVMPVYFGSQSKFASFQRQLNNYDFQRVQDRRQHGSLIYWHKNFSRTYPHMIQEVALKKGKTHHQHQSSTPPQLSKVVLELLLSVSSSCAANSSSNNSSLSKQIHYDDAVFGDDVLDEAVAQILCDSTRVIAGTGRTYYSDYCSSQEDQQGFADQEWDPDTESMGFWEEEEAHGDLPQICQSS